MNKFYVVYNFYIADGKLGSGNIIVSTDMKLSEQLIDKINEDIKERNSKIGLTGILITNIIKLESDKDGTQERVIEALKRLDGYDTNKSYNDGWNEAINTAIHTVKRVYSNCKIEKGGN